jgi:hypothetical protein
VGVADCDEGYTQKWLVSRSAAENRLLEISPAGIIRGVETFGDRTVSVVAATSLQNFLHDLDDISKNGATA